MRNWAPEKAASLRCASRWQPRPGRRGLGAREESAAPVLGIELAPELHSVSELLIADRDRERNR